jgi:two-component system cell cycle sensor histidine kinase/response regulator CckA
VVASDRGGAESSQPAPDGAGHMRWRYWLGPGRRPDSRQLALAAAALIIAVAIAALAGWGLGLPLLASWLPGLVQTKVNAALCLLLLGLALALSATNSGDRGVWGARALAVGVAAIAGATLLEHLSGTDLGIDQALVLDKASASSPHPGRFAVETALGFLSAAAAIIALSHRFRGFYPSEILGLLCAAIGGILMVGYLYGATSLLSLGSASQVSLPAAAMLAVTGAALVAADPDHGLVRQLADPGIGGQVLRRFLPAAILVVPAGAWVRLMGERAGLYDETIGLSIVVVCEALALVSVGAWTAARVERLEERRIQAEADLIRLGAAAATPLIETSAVGLAVLDRDLRYLYINPALAEIGGVDAVSSLGRDLERIVPAFGHETPAVLKQVLASGQAVRDLEIDGEARPGGRMATFLLSAEPLRDKAREIVGLSISVVDITARKSREDAVAEIADMRRQHPAIDE